MKLIERTDGQTAAEQLEIADTFLSRFAGLQLRKSLPAGRGLLLVPCGSIHMFFMRFPIDAVMLGRSGEILSVKRGLRPWSVCAAPRGTYAVLELAAGAASALKEGQRLAAVPGPGERLRPSVSFLKA